MDANVEVNNNLFSEIVSNNLDSFKARRSTWRLDRHKYISRLASSRVFGVFSSVSNFPPVEGKRSDCRYCRKNASGYSSPSLQPVS